MFLVSLILQIMLYQYKTTENVPFADVKGYWCESLGKDHDIAAQLKMFSKVNKKHDLELTMDIYNPVCDETRPLVLLMHGGAFFANNKNSEPVDSLCKELAEQGYVTASFDYRLGFHLNKTSIRHAGDRALEDAESAFNYLYDHSDEYGIDTSRIFIGGASSGAMTMLKLATKTQHEISGIIDMWGGVERLDQLDSITAPIIAFHGDQDKTVPYTEGYPLGGQPLMNYLYGSKPLIEHLQENGRDATLVTIPGYAHAPYRNKDYSFNSNYSTIRDGILDFLNRLCK